jgi:hypothetical protein
MAEDQAACMNDIAEKHKAIQVKEQELVSLETKRLEFESELKTNRDLAGYTSTSTCMNTSEKLKNDDEKIMFDTDDKGISEVINTVMLRQEETTADAFTTGKCFQCKVISMCNNACMHH